MTVNLAARLCSVAGRNQALLSDTALADLDARPHALELQSLRLKNVAATVRAASVPIALEPRPV